MSWQPLPDRRRPPQPVKVGLDRLVKSLGMPEVDAITTLFDRWHEVVGAEMAGNCKPSRLDGTRLVIVAKDHAWATELRWMERRLVDRCDAALGTGVVRSVNVTV